MFNRNLDEYYINKFVSLTKNHLGMDISSNDVKDAIALFVKVEKGIDGRIAGDVEDYLFNFFIRRHAAQKFTDSQYVNVEIGVLFGGSFIYTLKAVEGYPVKFIGIDPLDGYYIQDAVHGSRVDKYSQTEVSKTVLERNLKKFVNDGDYEIWQGYSTDKAIFENIMDKKISVLFIDGDHTYEGIKFDLLEYSKYVIDGGYIIIDNYNDMAWPEVKLFCDEYLANDGIDLGNPLVFGRSIILEKGKTMTPKEMFHFASEKRFVEKQGSLSRKKDQQIDNLTKEVDSLKKEVFELSKYKEKFLEFRGHPVKYASDYFFRRLKNVMKL